QITQYESC
ncbi:ABC transporter, permease domain protein, partial [Vibrio parahaemolyticus V-223/04]